MFRQACGRLCVFLSAGVMVGRSFIPYGAIADGDIAYPQPLLQSPGQPYRRDALHAEAYHGFQSADGGRSPEPETAHYTHRLPAGIVDQGKVRIVRALDSVRRRAGLSRPTGRRMTNDEARMTIE